MTKRKVAILGGGVGGLATAWALSNTPYLRDRYEITVYQRGWRLGGKGASGRNAARSNSIEEHGLHVWLGFYDNAFRVMSDVYEDPALSKTLQDFFKPIDHIVLYEHYDGHWNTYEFHPPRNQEPLGSGDRICFDEMVRRALDWLKAFWEDLVANTAPPSPVLAWVGDVISVPAASTLPAILDHIATLIANPRNHHRVCLILSSLRDQLWAEIVEPNVDDFRTRLFFQLFDTMATTTCGIIRDGLLDAGLDAANDLDYLEWLEVHGAKQVTLGTDAESGSPLIRGGYDLAFGFLDGDIKKRDMAAGVAIRGLLLLLFGYKGSVMFEMKTGMGDAIFGPLHKVLESRGVRFEFFMWVNALHLDAEHRFVEDISVTRQASPLPDYRYYVDVNNEDCWPNQPDWGNLVDGDQHRVQGAEFEREPSSPVGSIDGLLNRGTHFDEVVLAIPPGAHPAICADLINDAGNPRYKNMVDSSAVVMTQAFQLWMTESVGDLGWQHEEDSVMGAYVEPLDTYCNLSHLIAQEEWPTGVPKQPQSLAYFCGVLDELPNETWQQAQLRAEQNAIDFLETAAFRFWPNAATSGTFDWDKLVDNTGGSGKDRFKAQYVRANWDKSDRYVLSPKGSIAHRLDAHESGYANLTLAGDWTKNGIDAGCVEAALMSGLRAARAISGLPIEITGEDDSWLTCGKPEYIEYGGDVTSAPAFACENATLYGFVLRADGDKLLKLTDRVFSQPTSGEVRYIPLGAQALLTIGRIPHLTHSDPSQGYIEEGQAAIWLPLARLARVGSGWVPTGFATFVPYMFVDNQLSLVGGREVYGYAKNPGKVHLGANQDSFRVEAFGGNFGPASRADWFTAITVERNFSLSLPIPVAVHQMKAVLDTLLSNAVDKLGLAGVGAVFADLARLRATETFLKQFRAAGGGDRSAWPPRVVEAPIVIDTVHEMRYHPGSWTVTFDQRDSHSLVGELGIDDQTTTQAFSAKVDFTLQPGRVIWG